MVEKNEITICEDCGFESIEEGTCPECGGRLIKESELDKELEALEDFEGDIVSTEKLREKEEEEAAAEESEEW